MENKPSGIIFLILIASGLAMITQFSFTSIFLQQAQGKIIHHDETFNIGCDRSIIIPPESYSMKIGETVEVWCDKPENQDWKCPSCSRHWALKDYENRGGEISLQCDHDSWWRLPGALSLDRGKYELVKCE